MAQRDRLIAMAGKDRPAASQALKVEAFKSRSEQRDLPFELMLPGGFKIA